MIEQLAIPIPKITKFYPHRSARPMMARDADSIYWMSRYVERAEHAARLLLVNSNLLIDVGDLAPTFLQQQWASVLNIMRNDIPPGLLDTPGEWGVRKAVVQHLTFNSENPGSLLCCLSRARENARAIRENISAEMWESLNALYWSIRSDDAVARFEESPDDFYRQVMNGSMLFQGLTDQTIAQDQRWLFAQLAKHLERADVTARVIEAKFNLLSGAEATLDSALRNIHWMGVLRCCCSIEAYRRHHLGDMEPLRVAMFLILEHNFPRSIRHSVQKASAAIEAIRHEVNPAGVDPAERILGRLDAQLEYAEVGEMLSDGIVTYLQKIQLHLAEAAVAIQKTYFLY